MNRVLVIETFLLLSVQRRDLFEALVGSLKALVVPRECLAIFRLLSDLVGVVPVQAPGLVATRLVALLELRLHVQGYFVFETKVILLELFHFAS